MVFQNYALYPHMTRAREPRVRAQAAEAAEGASGGARVDEVAKTLGLDELLDRKPSALSGGQRQRVAMGRAIVREPKAFLMDEPLSNLDAKLRVSMRAELAKLHERLGVTTVYVTHDQVEAMTLGQRVAVLRDGLLQQFDTPQNLFHHPANLFVAAFIGSPSMNLVDAQVADGRVSFADFSFDLPAVLAGCRRGGRRDPRASGRRTSSTRAAAEPELPRAAGEARRRRGPRLREPRDLHGRRAAGHARRPYAPRPSTARTRGSSSPDDRAIFTAVRRRAAARWPPAPSVELAIDYRRLHFFDPATGAVLAGAAQPSPVA